MLLMFVQEACIFSKSNIKNYRFACCIHHWRCSNVFMLRDRLQTSFLIFCYSTLIPLNSLNIRSKIWWRSQSSRIAENNQLVNLGSPLLAFKKYLL